jgi:serine protease Do
MSRWGAVGIGSVLCAAWLTTSSAPVGAQDEARIERLMPGFFAQAGGQLGVRVEDVTAADVSRLKLPGELGARVREVTPESAAAKAGLKDGDVIVKYQGEAVQSAAQLQRLLRETPPGRTVQLEVIRDGASQRLSATLSQSRGMVLSDRDMEMMVVPHIPPAPLDPGIRVPELAPLPPMPPQALEKLKDRALLEFGRGRVPRKLGIEYQEISGQLARYFHLPQDQEEGILVSNVDEAGPAAKAGLKAGDVILKIDGESVRDSSDLQQRVARLSPGQEVTVTVQRDGSPRDLKVRLEGREPARRNRSGDISL